MSDVNVTSTSTDKNYISNIKAGKHEFIVDEPIDKGGLDTAPKPSELLGASLASCTSITLQMYMNHKEFPYKKVEVDVNFDVVTTESIKFNRHVIIEGNFDEKQQTRLLKVANSCPVHKVLEKGHEVKTTIEFV
ncbi:OsmC family protein [Empedobacter tilapiae]|uniref:OsmC family peroxiredoxin n=1 Tax=Empedobacter tilapiae TaxID=2491114 RepID=A0A4Z1BNN0_9FLAO|nr:OsmC family protein [Empedobacter tilapiae]TGN23695.1 OsmC family peroxiredoxin [Empedobacter tilapiae]